MTGIINKENKVCNGCSWGYHYCFIILLFCYLPLGCHYKNYVGLKKNQPGIEEFKAGETAFFQKNYTQAAAVFTKVAKENRDPKFKNITRYNLACTKLAMAQNEQAFDEAMSLLNLWHPFQPVKTPTENPKLLIQLVREIADLKKQTQLESQKKINSLTATTKAQNKKILKLQKLTKTLQYQISELENIDQEIQEKRKTN